MMGEIVGCDDIDVAAGVHGTCQLPKMIGVVSRIGALPTMIFREMPRFENTDSDVHWVGGLAAGLRLYQYWCCYVRQ